MHGYPDVLRSNEFPYIQEFIRKMLPPVKIADRVRGKGNQVGSNPEKQYIMFHVKTKNFIQTVKVGTHRLYHALEGIVPEPECAVAFAGQGTINTGITYFHPLGLISQRQN